MPWPSVRRPRKRANNVPEGHGKGYGSLIAVCPLGNAARLVELAEGAVGAGERVYAAAAGERGSASGGAFELQDVVPGAKVGEQLIHVAAMEEHPVIPVAGVDGQAFVEAGVVEIDDIDSAAGAD